MNLSTLKPGDRCWLELGDRCTLVSVAWHYGASATQIRIGASARADALQVVDGNLTALVEHFGQPLPWVKRERKRHWDSTQTSGRGDIDHLRGVA